MTRLLALPPARLPARLRPRYGAVCGHRRQQRTRCFVEGREKVAAGPHFQAGTFYSLSAGEKTFQKGWRGKTGPGWLCAPAPAPLRGRRRAARRRGLRAARPAGPEHPRAEQRCCRGRREERPPLPRRPPGFPGRGSPAAAFPCVRGAWRNGVSYVVSSPLKFIMVELQTAHGWKSYSCSKLDLKLQFNDWLGLFLFWFFPCACVMVK